MDVDSLRIVGLWLCFLAPPQLGTPTDSPGSIPELANLAPTHGVARFDQRCLASTLVFLIFKDPQAGGKPGLDEELRLTADQITKLKQISFDDAEPEKARDDPPERHFERLESLIWRRVPDILTKPQLARFEGLNCQIEGLAILRMPRFSKRLGLSEAQREKIASTVLSFREKSYPLHQRIFGSWSLDDAKPFIEQLNKLSQELDTELLKCLTAEQRAGWRNLVGRRYEWGTAWINLAP